MPRFVTIGYGDQAGYDRTDASVLEAAHEADRRLVESGAIAGIAGDPVQVRNHGGRGTHVEQGSHLTAPLPLAGFAVIEAADLDEAIRIASGAPCAVADGVVEVWPLQEPSATHN